MQADQAKQAEGRDHHHVAGTHRRAEHHGLVIVKIGVDPAEGHPQGHQPGAEGEGGPLSAPEAQRRGSLEASLGGGPSFSFGIALVYKALRMPKLEHVWRATGVMTVQILLGLFGLALAFLVLVKIVVPMLPAD